jgi:hypothetical protein
MLLATPRLLIGFFLSNYAQGVQEFSQRFSKWHFQMRVWELRRLNALDLALEKL